MGSVETDQTSARLTDGKFCRFYAAYSMRGTTLAGCRREADQPAFKPGSVGPGSELPDVAAIPLGRSLPNASSNQPGRRAWREGLPRPVGPSVSPLFGFAPGGVCRAVRVAASAVRSYRTLSPLPCMKQGGLLSVALSLGSPPPDVIRHRLSMEPGLSSPVRTGAAARPTDPARMCAAIAPEVKEPDAHPGAMAGFCSAACSTIQAALAPLVGHARRGGPPT